MASLAFSNLGDEQEEAKEQMISMYFSTELYSRIQWNMLSGMQGNHMWLIAMATLYAGEWRHLQKDTSHSAVAIFARALRKDPQVTMHALDELLTYALTTSVDGGCSAASEATAAPVPAARSRPVERPDPSATQPDSGTAGVTTSGKDAPQTDVEKA
ncbi:hypothetical protein SARC_03445 [Sphaeroforma arctica JP610]|uniref:Uncharacterized protein n=1 Tax=Sphaeroforma arctica JP610 TaxID=667725 RepID=A0A0L0G5P1_9EUKA|nr:hypothetical protein SARC_03445 [Sphaeroforma arctica JP610]KNC84340.1 hypothetical protein SARC_03445 [Sphaeroforma arctica JP610]|eukprot:XP_014158242.1 hypothetical protein SARC_03445 [Sphaeroforma arctica JP610]